MERKIRYWFVAFSFATKHGFGTSNSGIGVYGEFFRNEYAKKECLTNNPEAIEGSVVVTNFIEMSEEDYNQFWKK